MSLCGPADWTGNNFPVFFIRDGIQFPDLVHALKPNPKSHLQEGWRILDFLSSHPESTHIVSLTCGFLVVQIVPLCTFQEAAIQGYPDNPGLCWCLILCGC